MKNILHDQDHLESLTRSIGWKIFAEIQEKSASFWESVWWEKQIMEWCMGDEEVKLQVLRFIDVFPALKSDREIVRLLKEYFPHPKDRLPLPLRIGEKFLVPAMATPRAASQVIRFSMQKMARHFISGGTIAEAIEVLKKFRDQGVLFTMDLLGEAVTNEREADRYSDAYVEMLRALRSGLEEECGDEINISLKLSSLYSQFDPIHPEETRHAVAERLRQIFRAAAEVDGFVNIDMEQYAIRNLALKIFQEVIEEEEFKNSNRFGIVVQAYHRDSEDFLIRLLAWLEEKERAITIRLVKGAYWDYEVITAKQKNWPIPVYTKKWETDANFERLARILLEKHDTVRTAIGSHNVRSIARTLALVQQLQVPKNRCEFQLLYGMGDLIRDALVRMGLPVRVYTPYGELIPGMAYLVRRILENTSNESFLRQSFEEHLPREKLLASPREKVEARDAAPPEVPESEKGFSNCPLADFSREEQREAMRLALVEVKENFNGKYPVVIGGKTYNTPKTVASLNPSDYRETVGVVSQADPTLADKAVETAELVSRDWGRTSPETRAELLFQCAKMMENRRFEFASWMVFESGKTWREADADVVEAMDFLNYYAHEILRIGKPRKTDKIPGEDNFYGYRPRGVGLIIAPWNFPLAILTGMASGALAAGNTVILKPSNFSPVVAYKLMELFQEAGIPEGVVNYLPASGGEVGDYLVRQPEIDFITFTGSREVGLHIRKLASETGGEEKDVKNVVAEMGGKNPLIVDISADLDEAVKHALASGFGYGGQKCSAASRIIVVKEVYDAFLERFVEGVKSITVGQADDPASFYGPLIHSSAVEKVHKFTEIGRKEAELVVEVDVGLLKDLGYFVGPRVFSEVPPHAVIAQEEIFGPVVALLKVKNIREAVATANDTRYALTAGIFSRSPGNIDFARRELEAGNIYINRGITGAVVRRQPFGGFKMSGMGSKAGGPDYLKQFMFPVTITENIARHGFAPLEEMD